MLCGTAAVLSACSQGGKPDGGRAETVRPQELALPEVPVMLTAPEDRAAYVLAHFWDALDIGDTAACHRQEFMEQNVVNFLSLFPLADEEACTEGMETMLRLVAADPATFRIVTGTMERYLDDPNSPMRNEGYYIAYLGTLLRSPTLPEAERLRTADRLETAQKNRPGMTAADFAYIDRNGKPHRLHTTASAERLLVVFYDPDCEHCTEMLGSLHESAVVSRCVAEKSVTVLAIYTEGDRGLWDRTKEDMPQEWTVGMDADGIVEHGSYHLPAMPVFYLLDRKKRVLLKDATLPEIEAEIGIL